MAVPVEAFSIVIQNSVIEQKYPGGIEAYRRNTPNSSFCADQHLNRIVFMTYEDASAHVSRLVECGLTTEINGVFADIAVVSQQGPLKPCLWLSFTKFQGVLITWLTGTEMGNLFAPSGWTPESSVNMLKHMTAEEAERRLEFVRTEGKVDVYKDRETGQEMFVGRTELGHSAELEHNSLYKKGVELTGNLITIDARSPQKLTPKEQGQLKEALRLFDQVLQINQRNWNAMWLIGKIYQRFNDQENALQWFIRAHEIKPDQPDVAREASISAMEAGRTQQAIVFCERAIAARPTDATLKSNLALALLFSDRPADAQAMAREALRQTPKDKITASLLKVIDAVVAGKKPCPHHMRDITW